jgi:hypothetical protein
MERIIKRMSVLGGDMKSNWTPAMLPHAPPEEKCQCCCEWYWSCDLVNGLCQPCEEVKAELEDLRRKMERVMVKLETMQDKHMKFTGQRFVRPVRWGRTA